MRVGIIAVFEDQYVLVCVNIVFLILLFLRGRMRIPYVLKTINQLYCHIKFMFQWKLMLFRLYGIIMLNLTQQKKKQTKTITINDEAVPRGMHPKSGWR